MGAPQNPRRAAHLEMVGGKGGRQRLWEAIRQQRDDFTALGVASKADTDLGTANTYIQSLAKAKVIEVTQLNRGAGHDKHWKLIKDVGIDAPRLTRDGKPVTQGLANESMWRTMRMIRDFTFHELAALASSSEVTVAPGTARAYVKHLEAAGYLHVVTKGQGRGAGGIPTRYRFNPARNSGPRPPMIQRTKTVYDPNLGKVVWQEEPDHDC